jgi:hypothetical protein
MCSAQAHSTVRSLAALPQICLTALRYEDKKSEEYGLEGAPKY